MAASIRFGVLFLLILAYGDCRYYRNGDYTTERTPSLGNEILCKFSDVVFELMCRQTNAVKWYFIDSVPAIGQVTKVIIENVQSNSTEYNVFDVEKELFTRTTSLESLTITSSNLPNVHQLNLRKCPLLKTFNGSHNAISSLRAYTFWGTNLKVLDLSFNKIAFIDNDAFNVKPFGAEAVSSPSEMHFIEDDETKSDGSVAEKRVGLALTELYLHNNRLAAVNAKWFENLRQLTTLTLNNNLIREFDASTALANNKLLSHLSINNNLLSSIENLNIGNLPELTEFDVSSNEQLGKSGAKVEIDLSTVRMNNISIAACHISPNTLRIYAEHNKITALVVDSPSSGDYKLTELHVAHNELKDLKNITTLSLLQWLDLSFNLIEAIDGQAFRGLTQLTQLNLEHNVIHQVAANSFNGLTNLKFLNFSSNHLAEFVVGFSGTDLQDLDLSANALTSMNTNIKRGATELKRINIAENPWECSQLSDTLLFLLMDDIDVFSPDEVADSWQSNVRGIGCNRTAAMADETELIDPSEAEKLRKEIETMLDEKINDFERRITDLIIKIHVNANKAKKSVSA